MSKTKPTNQSVEEKESLKYIRDRWGKLFGLDNKGNPTWEATVEVADYISQAKQQAREEVIESIKKKIPGMVLWVKDDEVDKNLLVRADLEDFLDSITNQRLVVTNQKKK